MAPLQVPNGSFSQFGPICGHSGPGKWFKHITLDVPSPDPTLIHTDHIFVKRQAKDGRYFSKNTGIRRAKFKLPVFCCGRLRHCTSRGLLNFTNSSLTLLTCTRLQKDRQNYKNKGDRRAFFIKCPSRRSNSSLEGRLGNTASVQKKSLNEYCIFVFRLFQ